jgi:hypothetical protein
MSIDITAEVKFAATNDKDVYNVLLRDDANRTVIGTVVRTASGWNAYDLDDRPRGGNGSTRYMASAHLLEAYELANGLRDSQGRRVGRDPETKGYWVVLSPIGTKQSERWTDKAEAIAHLASLNSLTIYKLVTNHTDGPRVRHFATFEQALEAGQATDPDKDGSLIPNLSEAVAAEFGGTDEEYQQGLFWLRSNRYAAIYRTELTGATAEAYRQVFEFEEIGRQAALADESAAPALNAKVQAALEGRVVGDPVNTRIMLAFRRGYQQVRDQQAAEVLAAPKTDTVTEPGEEPKQPTHWRCSGGLLRPTTAEDVTTDQELKDYPWICTRCLYLVAGFDGDSLPDEDEETTAAEHAEVVYETVIQDEAAREITPVMVWPHGMVETGVEKLRKILTEIAYGHGDDSHLPKLYITHGDGLIEAVTRRVDYRKSGDDWIDEQWGLYAATDTQYADPLYLLGLRIDGRA